MCCKHKLPNGQIKTFRQFATICSRIWYLRGNCSHNPTRHYPNPTPLLAQMQLNRVEAMIGPGNTASIRLVKKFGFVEEGRLRGHYCKKGTIEDSLVFGLLKAEYSPLKGM